MSIEGIKSSHNVLMNGYSGINSILEKKKENYRKIIDNYRNKNMSNNISQETVLAAAKEVVLTNNTVSWLTADLKAKELAIEQSEQPSESLPIGEVVKEASLKGGEYHGERSKRSKRRKRRKRSKRSKIILR